MTKKDKTSEEQTEGLPVCPKCGNLMMEENGEMVCPHCQGEIDFMAGEDNEELL